MFENLNSQLNRSPPTIFLFFTLQTFYLSVANKKTNHLLKEN